ncbi:MAG: hypothetical protein EBT22_11700 [Chloroflexi bacterium]|nr:hypothetical protein [Chloroflexota bacterium]
MQMVFLFGQPMLPARQPRQAGMVELLVHYNDHQVDVLRRRAAHDLAGAKERLHVVLGLIIGAANAPEIVRIFQGAADRAEAKTQIRARYNLSEAQAETIAGMTLAQVTRLDASRFANERRTLEERIAELEALLADPARQVEAVKAEMREIIAVHGDPRRTVIDPTADATVEVSEVAPSIETKPVTTVLTADGHLKTVPPDTFRRSTTREYPVISLGTARTVDALLLVTDTGKVCVVRVQDLPEGTRASRGEPVRKYVRLEPTDTVVRALTVETFDQGDDNSLSLVMVTQSGRIKRSAISEYRSLGATGVLDFRLSAGDRLVSGFLSSISDDGACPPTGSEGPTGLFTLSATGHGKRTAIAELPAKGRGTGGVLVAPNGTVLAVASIHPHDATVLVRTSDGTVTRITPTQVPLQSRTGRGIPLVSISADDPVVAVLPMPVGA